MIKYVIPPYNTDLAPFAYWEGAFSNEELDWLQNKAKQGNVQAQVGEKGSGGVELDVRRSKVHWLDFRDEYEWIYYKLTQVVSSLNAQFFRFNLTGFGEHIQLTSYDEDELGMYNWHVDFGGDTRAPSRKLSLVMQLSDPVEYEGGVLELKINSDNITKINKRRGLIVVFPSWTLHQVTPVVSGTRQSLVSWITGPNFK